eukprot:Gb_35741 [translate_table: standard]
MNATLEQDISVEEITEAMNKIDPGKKPGPDGFPLEFYRVPAEDRMAPLLEEACQETWIRGALHPAIKAPIISLAPKISKPVSIKHWRPISLCNTSYKIIAKVIVVRLAPFMQELINDSQSAFMRGRRIADNITILAEALHSARTRKIPLMLLKLDITKAYDTLQWDFILTVLRCKGFSWLSLKQIKGCPLSSYLYVLATEGFPNIRQWLKEMNLLSSFPANGCRMSVTHQLFADDITLLGSLTSNEAVIWNTTLKIYASASGQQINKLKSRHLSWESQTDIKIRQLLI